MKRVFQYTFYYLLFLLILLTGCTSDAATPTVVKELEYKIKDNAENLIKVKAKPEAGFYYDYYLYVPRGVKQSSVKYMLVEPNNSGTASDDSKFHDDKAAKLIENGVCNKIAKELEIPLLVPTFDRPRTDWKIYTHALDRDTLMVKGGKLERIDLQLIKMIENAQLILSDNNIKVENKVFMNGFSASGNFVNRFVALHPEKIKAAASGGVNGMPILPYENLNGEKLIYHVGIADIDEIAGIKFNIKEYNKVPQYIYMGYFDTNDTLKFADAYSEEETRVTQRVLGITMKDRWLKSQEILKEAGVPAQMVTYNGTTHQIRPEMIKDIIAFFRANSGKDIKFIEPFQYPFIAQLKELDKVHVKAAYWYGDSRIPSWIKGLNQNNFVILVEEWIPGRDYEQLSEFKRKQPRENLEFILKHYGKADIKAEIYSTGSFSMGDGSFQGYIVKIPDSELSKMEKGIQYTLHLANEKNNSIIINRGVTITRPK